MFNMLVHCTHAKRIKKRNVTMFPPLTLKTILRHLRKVFLKNHTILTQLVLTFIWMIWSYGKHFSFSISSMKFSYSFIPLSLCYKTMKMWCFSKKTTKIQNPLSINRRFQLVRDASAETFLCSRNVYNAFK